MTSKIMFRGNMPVTSAKNLDLTHNRKKDCWNSQKARTAAVVAGLALSQHPVASATRISQSVILEAPEVKVPDTSSVMMKRANQVAEKFLEKNDFYIRRK